MSARQRLAVGLLVMAFVVGAGHVALAGTPRQEGRLTAVIHWEGQDDIAVRDLDGTWRIITSPTRDDRDPAWSPDGRYLAYASRWQRNWDIYTLDLATGRERRVTTNPHFDAHPTWSPDGRYLAFESSRLQDLDVFVVDLQSGQVRDLTKQSSAHDYAPAWSPDGQWVAFTSWRDRNREIYVIRPDGTVPINLTRNPAQDEHPVWSPDGRWIAFVSDRDGDKAVFAMRFPLRPDEPPRRLSWSGYDDSPAWSPDSRYLWFVSPRVGGTPLYDVDFAAADALPQRIVTPAIRVKALVNTPPTLSSADIRARESHASPPLLVSRANDDNSPARLVSLAKVVTNSPKLNSLVVDSFRALRARVRDEVSYDFLARLSDAYRPLSFDSDGSDYLSWHKAGRAIDTLVDLDRRSGRPMMEVVRDDRRTETFWQVYLRCAAQDGSCGEPLTDAPWDLSYKARWEDAPGQGGHTKPVPVGYYVNFDLLARDYGWMPISSYDDADFSWKETKTALEYWHFQKTDGLTWYEAMHEIHDAKEMQDLFTWEDARQHNVSFFLRQAKGLPVPPSAWRPFRMVMP
jgi:TolB protein